MLTETTEVTAVQVIHTVMDARQKLETALRDVQVAKAALALAEKTAVDEWLNSELSDEANLVSWRGGSYVVRVSCNGGEIRIEPIRIL